MPLSPDCVTNYGTNDDQLPLETMNTLEPSGKPFSNDKASGMVKGN
jgi:hypothetical protein